MSSTWGRAACSPPNRRSDACPKAIVGAIPADGGALGEKAELEIVPQVGAEEAAKGNVLPLGDLIIGACALGLGYAVGTGNLRHFRRIPGLTVVAL